MVDHKCKSCGYYHIYNEVQLYMGAWLPKFGSWDERCTHPSVVDKNLIKGAKCSWAAGYVPGMKIMAMVRCPKLNSSENG